MGVSAYRIQQEIQGISCIQQLFFGPIPHPE